MGVVPGTTLSDTVRADLTAKSSAGEQPGLFFGLGDVVPAASGVGVVVRVVAKGGLQPMLRYRTFLDPQERVSLRVVASGHHGSGAERGASFEMSRCALEAVVDLSFSPRNPWFQLHVHGGVSLAAVEPAAPSAREMMATEGIARKTRRRRETPPPRSAAFSPPCSPG